MQELGADEVIDYTQEIFEEVLRGNPVDVVVDTIGGTVLYCQRRTCFTTCASALNTGDLPSFTSRLHKRMAIH